MTVYCVCADMTSLSRMWYKTIESKLISLCLISDHSLITNPHIFFKERVELSFISVDIINVKLSISNNFDLEC